MTNEQLDQWRQAIAANNRAKRNRRGKRDKWKRAQPVVIVQPRRRDSDETTTGETT